LIKTDSTSHRWMISIEEWQEIPTITLVWAIMFEISSIDC